jgi:hypothetical protein
MRLRLLPGLLVVPLASFAAAPAQAQDNYPPEVLSTQTAYCEDNNLVVTVDGAQPNSDVHIQVDWDNDNVIDIDIVVQTDGTGSVTVTRPMPAEVAEFTVHVSGVIQPNPDDPDTYPFEREIFGDRSSCPDLPGTGGDSLDIGRTALFVTLAGAFLAAVAFRRRSRDHADATSA